MGDRMLRALRFSSQTKWLTTIEMAAAPIRMRESSMKNIATHRPDVSRRLWLVCFVPA